MISLKNREFWSAAGVFRSNFWPAAKRTCIKSRYFSPPSQVSRMIGVGIFLLAIISVFPATSKAQQQQPAELLSEPSSSSCTCTGVIRVSFKGGSCFLFSMLQQPHEARLDLRQATFSRGALLEGRAAQVCTTLRPHLEAAQRSRQRTHLRPRPNHGGSTISRAPFAQAREAGECIKPGAQAPGSKCKKHVEPAK